jgi:hypothetical protein
MARETQSILLKQDEQFIFYERLMEMYLLHEIKYPIGFTSQNLQKIGQRKVVRFGYCMQRMSRNDSRAL